MPFKAFKVFSSVRVVRLKILTYSCFCVVEIFSVNLWIVLLYFSIIIELDFLLDQDHLGFYLRVSVAGHSPCYHGS